MSEAGAMRTKTPITLLSGFLGAGKTTLLRNMLENKEGLKIGIVVNDVASVNIDAKLMKGVGGGGSAPSDTVELQNGCACCSAAEEFMQAIDKLVELAESRGVPYDHIVVESTGVAEPNEVRSTFQRAVEAGEELMEKVELKTLVTVVDASTFIDLFDSTGRVIEQPELGEDDGVSNVQRKVVELLVEQVETADILVLNKADQLASAEQLGTLKQMVAAMNPLARSHVTEWGRLPLSAILGAVGGGDESAALRDQESDLRRQVKRLREERAREEAAQRHKHAHGHAHAEPADAGNGNGHGHGHDGHGHAHAEPADAGDGHGHGHGHGHEGEGEGSAHHAANGSAHSKQEAHADQAGADTSHAHGHAHAHAHGRDVKAAEGAQPTKAEEAAAGAQANGHGHEHHAHGDAAPCEEMGCSDPSHAHGHGHGHGHAHGKEAGCADEACTDPSHAHSHGHGHGHSTARHAERFGITSFVYSRRRPFHPQRLVERCIQQLPAKQNLALKEQLQALPKDAKSPFAALVRSKGFLWLSNNHLEAFYWAHAGNYFEVKKQGLWWAAIERKDWPAEDAADIEAEVVPVFGDRRQELVFIGIGLDERALTAELDLCLLSDAEMETYKTHWATQFPNDAINTT